MGMRKSGISPSLMCGNSLKQEAYIRILNGLPIPWYHIDFMDGHFVPNIGLNLNFIRDLRAATNKMIEVHLMCTRPLEWIEKLLDIGADAVSFHIESTHAPVRCLNAVGEAGVLAGIILSPATPPGMAEPLFEYLDYITLMGVEPGFEGQSFLPGTFSKTEKMRKLIAASGRDISIQVDGGVDQEIGKKLLNCGADILVGGVPTLFSDEDLLKNFKVFQSLF